MIERYYVCHADMGVSYYNCDDDAMVGMSVSPNKEAWLEFTWYEAKEVKRVTGWKIVKVYDEEMMALQY